MEEFGILRYALPAICGGFGVFFLINSANNAPNNNKCYLGLAPLFLLFLGTLTSFYAVFSLYFDNPPNDDLNNALWLKPAYILFSLIVFGYLLDLLQRRITWSDEGLKIRRVFRGELSIRWDDVENITYNNWAQWWRISFSKNRSVIFYDMMRGSKYLINECNRNIKPSDSAS